MNSISETTAESGMDSYKRRLWLWGGHLSFVLGAIGALLPGLPTTVFWIIAAVCYARSAPHLRDRIYSQPRFGSAVRDFVEHGQLSRKGKWFAVAGMSLGALVCAFTLPPWLTASLGVVMSVVAVVLLRLPEPG
ncbi:MAG: YbaN family protein [Chromatiales bacterium]|nr:YbaN family protein [Chromatiales bacterium]